MNYIVIVSVAAYLVLSLMAFQVIDACQHEIQEIYKRHMARAKYSVI